jgi:hypothetical protein
VSTITTLIRGAGIKQQTNEAESLLQQYPGNEMALAEMLELSDIFFNNTNCITVSTVFMSLEIPYCLFLLATVSLGTKDRLLGGPIAADTS